MQAKHPGDRPETCPIDLTSTSPALSATGRRPTSGCSSDAIDGDARRFAREDSVEQAWRIVAPILDLTDSPAPYDRGSWGPAEADRVAAGDRWHQPAPPPSGGRSGYRRPMCRSIKTLREPYTEQVTEADMHAAALQYVRKVSGFRKPAAHNAAAFDRAVDAIAAATRTLLEEIEVRPAPHRQRAG